MPDLQQEREQLAQADQHIAEGRRRVTDQVALIARLAQEEQDTTEAWRLLRTLEEALEGWYEHRQIILGKIARLDQPAR
jgi:ferritin